MNNELTLSVVVITYNQEQYIAKTLDSILNQKHNFSYEIVIGEDCSTDGTKKIIESYVAKYPEIIKPLYNNTNKGLIKNYFETIAQCKGKYIMQCAGDDYWLPGKIDKQIDFMENNIKIAMCYGKAKIYSENQKKFLKSVGGNKNSIDDLLFENTIPALTICMKNSDLQEYIYEINPLKQPWLMEDYPMWLWFSANKRIKYLNKTFGIYRMLTESVSHSKDENQKLIFNQNTESIRQFFIEKYNKDYISTIKNINSAFKTKNYSTVCILFKTLKKRNSKILIKFLIASIILKLKG